MIYAQVPSPCKRVLYFIALWRFKPTLCPLSTLHSLSHYIFWQLPCENCIFREVYASYLPWRGLIPAPITHCLVGIRSEKVLAWQLALAALAAAGSSNSAGVGEKMDVAWGTPYLAFALASLSLFLCLSSILHTTMKVFTYPAQIFLHISVHVCVCVLVLHMPLAAGHATRIYISLCVL